MIPTIHNHFWNGVGLLVFVYLASLLFAAVLAPPIYWGINAWSQAYPNPLNTYLAGKGFEDYFDRLRWVPLLIGFPWLLKKCGLWSWRSLGVHLDGSGCCWWRIYFMGGVGLVAGTALIQSLAIPIRLKPDLSLESVSEILFMALAGGLLGGFLEEIVFRGLIFRLFYRSGSSLFAVVGSALFFAYTHFKMPDFISEQTNQVVSWGSGFFVGYWTLIGISQDFDALRFFTLLVLGIALGLLFLQKRSLMPCIGLHTGIVAAMLCYRKGAVVTEKHWLLDSDSLTDGVLPLALLGLLALMLAIRQNSGARSQKLEVSSERRSNYPQ